MASARFAWGIDIGNRALKAIRLSRGDAGLRIDDFEVIEHENVLSNSGDNKESLVQSALANFVQRHPTKGGVAAISVSGVSSFARFIKLPPVESRKIPEIVKFEAIQQIPFPLADVEWSYQLFQTPDSPDVEVGIFAMRRELINSHIKNFTDVDLNVQTVQMNPLAVYNAMYYDGRLKGTTMIIDLGAENTDLIIADGETIWLRSIPIGGNNFTEVLVKSFKLPFAKAEELKRNAATSKYARQIFQAMRPVFADLVAEVQRSMGFYASVHRDSRIKKIIALGGTFRLPGLQKYLQQNLQLEVDRMDRLAAGSPADGKMAATFNDNLLSLVSAYGLAIQAMGEGKITSSLLPEHIRREKMWRDKTKWFGAAAGGFVLGTAVAVGGYYLSQFEYKQAEPTREKSQALLRTATALDNRWSSEIQDAGAPDRLRITNVRSMLVDRGLWPHLLNDLFSAAPPIPANEQQRAALNKMPRDSRNLVFIDAVQSTYYPDLPPAVAAVPALNVGATAPQPGQPGQPPTAPPAPGTPVASNDPSIPTGTHGYIVTLILTTPHRDGFLYVLNNFKKNLEAMNYDWMTAKGKVYYIAKVSTPLGAQQLKDDPNRLQAMTAAAAAAAAVSGAGTPAPGTTPVTPAPIPVPIYPRPGQPPMFQGGYHPGQVVPPPGQPGGFQPGAAQPGGSNPAANSSPYADRNTGEDRTMDWEMKIQLVVIVDPPPLVKAAPMNYPAIHLAIFAVIFDPHAL